MTHAFSAQSANANKIVLGGSSGAFFTGYIKDLRLWNKAISGTEIEYFMRQSPRFDQEGLAMLFQLNEGEGTQLEEHVSNTLFAASSVQWSTPDEDILLCPNPTVLDTSSGCCIPSITVPLKNGGEYGIELPENTVTNFVTTYTIEFWLYVPSLPATSSVILSKTPGISISVSPDGTLTFIAHSDANTFTSSFIQTSK